MKMRKWKCWTAMVVAVALTMTTLAGCGQKDDGSSSVGGKGTLKVTVAKLGYGDQWLIDLAEAFEEKTGTKVEIVSKVGDSGVSAIKTEMESRKGDSDIYFTKSSDYFKKVYTGAVTIGDKTYDCEYADLTDVWTSKVDGDEGKTIEEKMNSAAKDYYNVEGKYYGLPWASYVMGIVRNKNVWDKLSLTDSDIPRTTDEMFALCDTVKAKGTAPFIYSLESEYYSSYVPLWFEQYEGPESMENFYNGLDPIGENSYNLYTYDGQVKALEVLQKLVDEENGYQHPSSISAPFTDMQSSFLLDQALFCVNGSWIETEMGENYANANIDYIKTPVVSSIIEKLDSVNDDATLSAVIQYIDGDVANAPSGVTEEDIKTVREARQVAYSYGGMGHIAVVPAYSAHIDTAKDFLKFMYSDEGMNVYYKATFGSTLPAECTSGYDTSVEISAFRENVNAIIEEGAFGTYDKACKTKVYALGGVNRYYMNGCDSAVRTMRKGKTPEEVCAMNNEYLRKNWANITNY